MASEDADDYMAEIQTRDTAVKNLLLRGQKADALKLALENPPLLTKDQSIKVQNERI